LFISTNTGKVKRIKLEKMLRKARNAIGVRIIKLRSKNHKVISISLVDKDISENVLTN
jgi:DNA gyrase/topoisomerase IV subunit A